MSSRYMNYLRKNGKFIMVVMSIVCMITFVVGAALSDWANSTRRAAEGHFPAYGEMATLNHGYVQPGRVDAANDWSGGIAPSVVQ